MYSVYIVYIELGSKGVRVVYQDYWGARDAVLTQISNIKLFTRIPDQEAPAQYVNTLDA